MRRLNLILRRLASVAAAVLAISLPLSAAGKTGTMSTPTLTCAAGSTQASIALTVTAGATGAPAGVTVQWETLADYNAYGWPTGGYTPDSYCDASFSGNASESNYNLAPNASVTVQIGDLLLDNGASTSCPLQPLACGTTYVFRVFAHATSTMQRSAFSGPTSCSTLPCTPVQNCTLTLGYWATHPCAWPFPFAPVPVTDPATSAPADQCTADLDPTHTLMLGNVAYTQAQLTAILNTPSGGNGLITLAHQLIAAKLNIAAGADGSAAADAIVAADALIGNLVVGTNFLAPKNTSGLVATLTSYNEGTIGPGHCD